MDGLHKGGLFLELSNNLVECGKLHNNNLRLAGTMLLGNSALSLTFNNHLCCQPHGKINFRLLNQVLVLVVQEEGVFSKALTRFLWCLASLFRGLALIAHLVVVFIFFFTVLDIAVIAFYEILLYIGTLISSKARGKKHDVFKVKHICRTSSLTNIFTSPLDIFVQHTEQRGSKLTGHIHKALGNNPGKTLFECTFQITFLGGRARSNKPLLKICKVGLLLVVVECNRRSKAINLFIHTNSCTNSTLLSDIPSELTKVWCNFGHQPSSTLHDQGLNHSEVILLGVAELELHIKELAFLISFTLLVLSLLIFLVTFVGRLHEDLLEAVLVAVKFIVLFSKFISNIAHFAIRRIIFGRVILKGFLNLLLRLFFYHP
mmetsp:Transcript_19906/g.39070  ORF Transcript_19906/g.39070 Transcript_19906/m.39070 type:complete len:374 (-) Transcript_19906:210-1331(-)